MLPLEERNFSIAIIDDDLLEAAEVFQIQFSSDEQAILITDAITVTILDNESE